MIPEDGMSRPCPLSKSRSAARCSSCPLASSRNQRWSLSRALLGGRGELFPGVLPLVTPGSVRERWSFLRLTGFGRRVLADFIGDRDEAGGSWHSPLSKMQAQGYLRRRGGGLAHCGAVRIPAVSITRDGEAMVTALRLTLAVAQYRVPRGSGCGRYDVRVSDHATG